MTEKRAKWALGYRVLGLTVSVGGILLHLLENRLADTGFMVRHKLAYFTIQTNVFCALLFGVLVYRTLRRKPLEVSRVHPEIHLGVTFYITMTMLGFWLLLVPATGISWNPVSFAGSMLLHTVTPLMTVGDWLLFGQHGRVEKKSALRWLAYPAAYLVFVMVYSRTIRTPYYSFRMGGEVIDLMYPYPFLDPSVMGPWGGAAAAAGLAAVFYLLGRVYVFLDRKLAK